MRVPLLAVGLLAAVPALAQPSEQFRAGQAAYAETCAVCHGANGRGGAAFATPIWGQGSNIAAKFPTGAQLLEYNQLLMPFDDPSRVSDELKLAITLYMLANHGAVPVGASLTEAGAAGVAIR